MRPHLRCSEVVDFGVAWIQLDENSLFGPEADKDTLSGFSELSEVIGNLSLEVENAKKLSHGQLKLLKGQLQDVKARAYSMSEEKDEALRLLARVKDERDQLKEEKVQFNKERDQFYKERDRFDTVKQQLNDEREQLQSRLSFLRSNLDELEQEREENNKARKEEQEEAHLTLLQLHQVQDELEHYFVLSRQQSELLEANEELQARFTALLADVRR